MATMWSALGTSVDTANTAGGLGPFERAVAEVSYRPGWSFRILGYGGGMQALRIVVDTVDSSTHLGPFLVQHDFPVSFSGRRGSVDEWVDWIFGCVLIVERHEAAEFFRHRGRRPFMPPHGPGADVYDTSRKWWSETAVRQ